MQEAHGCSNACVGVAMNEALGLIARCIACTATIGLWEEPAKRPALAILERRPVWIEDVTFVKDGVYDLVDEGLIHDVTTSLSRETLSSRSVLNRFVAIVRPRAR